MHGGETEIDFNNGKIVEYGRKHYIQTPLNLTFTNLVNAVSNKNLGKISKIFKN
jgi:ketopantoate reductase